MSWWERFPSAEDSFPKAGIAWAGTFAVGLSLERLYRLGYGFTRAERRAVYEEAYDHAGLPDDPRRSANPAISSLYAGGLIRSGPLAIGLDLDQHCAVIDAEGAVSTRLFAIGPLTRGVFWESIALPDIRNQCASLAALLADRLETARQELPGVR